MYRRLIAADAPTDIRGQQCFGLFLLNFQKYLLIFYGNSDVGDFMMVTDFRCWWQNHYVVKFFRYVGDFLNVLNRQHPESVTNISNLSPTHFVSNIRHQHRYNQSQSRTKFLRIQRNFNSLEKTLHRSVWSKFLIDEIIRI